MISTGFIGCWTPYGLVSLWSIFRDSSTIPPEVSLLPCMFAKSSTVYNPVIYYFFSQSFKREVNQLSWLCLCCKTCKVSNTINDNNIYMVSASIKPKEQPQSTLQEITESKSVTLGWKTGLFFGTHLGTKTELEKELQMCGVNNVLSGQKEVFFSPNGVWYYTTAGWYFLTGHDMWEDVFAQCIKCCECGANKSYNIESNLCSQLVKPCYEIAFQRQSCWAHPCPWRTHHSKHLFVIYYIYTHTQRDVEEAEEWEENQLPRILKLYAVSKCALWSDVGCEQSKLKATLFIVVTTFYCSVSHRLLPVGMHYFRGRFFSIQFTDIKAKCFAYKLSVDATLSQCFQILSTFRPDVPSIGRWLLEWAGAIK